MLYTAKLKALPIDYMPVGELYTDVNLETLDKCENTATFFIREYFVKEHNILYHDYMIEPDTLQELPENEGE